MKLTQREKILLVILGFIALSALDYWFVIKPQCEKLGRFAIEQLNTRAEVERVKLETAAENPVHKNLENAYNEVGKESARFYPSIIQEKIIVLLDGLFKKCQMQSASNSFAEIQYTAIETPVEELTKPYPAKEMVDSYMVLDTSNSGQTAAPENKNQTPSTQQTAAPATGSNGQAASQTQQSQQAQKTAQAQQTPELVENVTVTIQFTQTSYDRLRWFINELEALERNIVIKNISISKAEGSLLSGSISICFYALPKINSQDGDYLNWSYNNSYGKSDPFNP